MNKIRVLGAIALGAGVSIAGPFNLYPAEAQQADWPVYGGQDAQDHYSSLAQINRSNVKDLVVAWKYDTSNTEKAILTVYWS